MKNQKNTSTPTAPRRLSLRWQLILGMILGFLIVFTIVGVTFYELYDGTLRTLPSSIYLWLGMLVVGSLVITMALSYWLAHVILRPMRAIEETIEAFENDPLTTQRAMQATKVSNEFSDVVSVLNRMIDRLQALITAQQQFVSDVSHELRTPVAIVKGHMDLLNRWGKSEPEILDDSIASSLAEIRRMETLISEMLHLTRAEQIPVESNTEVTDIGGTARRVFQNFQMLHPDFHFNLDDDLHEAVYSPIRQDHLEQVMIILADNAVKYSRDRYEIHFALSVGAQQVEIGIQDFGEGLSAEDCTHVFDRFYRVDKARSRHKGGNGLGLSIADRLIKAYGGDITLESAEGSGSIFTIRLPRCQAPAAK